MGKWFPKAIAAVDDSNHLIPALERSITQAFITGKPVSEHTFYRTKANPKLPVAVTVSPILLDGKPVGAIEIFRDISMQHEVDRMKSEFISIASHQLRTPLSAVNTYTHMLFSGYVGDLTPSQKDFMLVILSSIDRMNELINTLLDISRIESGMLRIKSEPVNYPEIISSIVRELQGYANDKNIQLVLKMPVQPLNVTTDPLLIKEVCANLLSNAIKYTPSGGKVTLTLTTKGSNAVLSVKDTGYGIPADSQKYLFTKFFRANNALQKETYGTGLGLYMVKLITDSIGGKVWFSSRENAGSTFYFSIPIGKG